MGGESASLFPDNANNATLTIKTRSRKFVYGRRETEDGPLDIITLEESLWYKLYVHNYLLLEEKSALTGKFRTQFRLPYSNYLKLVADVSADSLFDRWCGHKPNNQRCSPIQLLVLGSLRYLGLGWTFNDIEESTGVAREVHCFFFTNL